MKNKKIKTIKDKNKRVCPVCHKGIIMESGKCFNRQCNFTKSKEVYSSGE